MKTSFWTFLLTILLSSSVMLGGCKKETSNTLTVSPTTIEFEQDGSFTSISIKTDAGSWQITNPASEWLELSRTSGTEQTTLVTLSVNSKTVTPRLDTLTVEAGNATPVKIFVSQPSSEYLYFISANDSSLNFKRGGQEIALNINTNAPSWTITYDEEWLSVSPVSGGSGTSTIHVTAVENPGADPRSTTLTISADYAPALEVTATQKGEYYPNYNTSPIPPDASGMSSTAMQLANDIVIGWNIGNSLEASGGETAWGNPMITQELIQLVKANGFNAIRIPCSYNQYMANSTTAQLKSSWLERVRQVVQYCVDEDMYAILNIHWDGGWLENNCTPNAEEAVTAKQKAFWEQIATHLRDFDEHLLFASANEPNVENSTQMSVLKNYHQAFINAVRSTGGRNYYRVLVVQGPYTDIEKTYQLMNSLPEDSVEDRMMVEIHYYTPWNFCGLEEDASWGKMFYYWGEGHHSATDTTRNATWGEEETVDSFFGMMKSKFVDHGIPVVLGEYSAMRRGELIGQNLVDHLASRAYYYYYVTRQAKANGMIPFYWDNGYTGNHGCAIFNRDNNTVFDQQALDGLIEGANE